MTLQKARSMFEEYCRLNAINPLQENTLLLSAREQVTNEIANNGHSKEAARLAHRILSFLGEEGLQERERLLRSYMAQSLHREERFWANWELVDTLALLKKCTETVNEQLLFLQWAKANMHPNEWAAVMYDGTQAHCWACENKMDEWFAIYFNMMDSIEQTSESRGNRATYVRTAGEHLALHDKFDQAVQQAERLRQIADEDREWPERIIFWLGAGTIKLEVFRKTENWKAFEEQVNSIMSELQNETLGIERRRFIANDLGACLLWAGRYGQASTLFEFAVKHGDGGVAHYWLAICIWASKKDREKTLRHLAVAENGIRHNPNMRGRYYDMFIAQPEFSDVWDDAQFRSIFQAPGALA